MTLASRAAMPVPRNANTVFVVADNDLNFERLEKSCQSAGDFELRRCHDCDEVTRQLERGAMVDCVIVDMELGESESTNRLLRTCCATRTAVTFAALSSPQNRLRPTLSATISLAEKPKNTGKNEEIRPSLAVLSNRETEVLELLVSGLTNKEAAAKLFLSVRTVEKHRANAQRKLKTRSIAELTRMWMIEKENLS